MAGKEQGQELEVVRSDKFMSIYSNSANLEVTPWDFRLVFGELVKTGAGESRRIEQHVAIIMSPQHAKALLDVLQSNVAEYEKRVGEIKLPKSEPEAVAAVAARPAVQH